MEYSEKWGKDIDEAVRLALEDLGATENEVMVTVLEEPAKGFLGLGSKLAKVRVERIKIEDEPEHSDEAAAHAEAKKGVRDFRKKDKKEGAESSAPKERPDRGRCGGRSDRSERSDRRERYDSHSDDDGELIDYDFDSKPTLSERPENLVEAPESAANVFFTEMIKNMGLDVEIAPFENEECVYIEVNGEDSKTVIGKRGQTLDSIQYLTNLVSNKDRSEYKRVIIDVEGYRSRREKTLERLAVKLASKVKKSGRSVKLEPMNPYERKVIHATLQNVAGVTTRSEGNEPYRRVIIDKER
jgi:spoIIIJ-associated protein